MSVAGLVEALTTKLKRRQTEQKISVWASYRELLVEAATGKKVDLDELELVLEQLAKTPEQFQGDVERYSDRVVRAERHARLPTLQAQLRAAEALREKRAAEYDETIARLGRGVGEATAQVRALEGQISSLGDPAGDLITSIMDPVLIERRDHLQEQRKDIANRRRPIYDRREEAAKNAGYRQRVVEGIESRLGADEKRELPTHILSDLDKRDLRSQLHQARQEYKQAQGDLAAAQEQLDAIDIELRALEKEEAEFRSLCLVP